MESSDKWFERGWTYALAVYMMPAWYIIFDDVKFIGYIESIPYMISLFCGLWTVQFILDDPKLSTNGG